jgi:hypothetical protein
MKNTLWAAGIIAVYLIISCKGTWEKQGDEQLQAGNYIKAIQYYKNVKDKGSEEFNDNLTMAYTGAMAMAYDRDPDINKLIMYMEKIDKLLKPELKPETKKFYCETVVSVGEKLIGKEEFSSEELGFKLFKRLEEFGEACKESMSEIDSIRSAYISKTLKEAEEHYLSSKKEPSEGIMADYILSKLTLFVDETPEIKELQSKVRQANLATFLLYSYAVEKPIPAINRYGVLLAITKFTRSADAAVFQVQALNASTGIFTFVSDGFTLVDKDDKEYKPSGKRGGFSKTKEIERGDRTEVGELTFKVPKGVKLDYLQYDSEGGVSIKYMP